MTTVLLDLQIATDDANLPSTQEFTLLVNYVIAQIQMDSESLPVLPVELTIRVVDEEEAQQLNLAYRERDYATNVLSFPFEQDFPAGVELPTILLGDLIICAPVIQREANQQNKNAIAHWAHMVVHGCLHLLGYDHIKDQDAEHMEALETQLLEHFGFADPYRVEHGV